MSQTPNKNTEEKRAAAACEIAKEFIPAAILAQGPINPNATNSEVAEYFNRACTMAFSLAGLYRRKCIELIESAKAMDAKAESNAA